MKKIIFLLGLAPLFASSVVAQNEQIQDGKFEYWEEKTGQNDVKYDELSAPFWTSLNNLASLPPEMFTGPVTMFKDKGYSGEANDFAPRMVSNEMLYGDSGMIFLPGVIGTLDVVFDKLTAKTGTVFTSKPVAIKGYMKCAPANGDSASIYVGLFSYNSELGMRSPIGLVDKVYKETISEWTEFNLPIKYFSNATPDSAIVLFVSSAGYDRNFRDLFNCKGQLGSSLTVDNVEFVYETTATTPNAVLASSKLYPNPSVDGIFQLQTQEACTVEVFGLGGQRVLARDVKAGACTLDLSACAKGVYLVRLYNENGGAVLKAVRP